MGDGKGTERTSAELSHANQALAEIKARFEAVYHHHYQLTGLLDVEGRLIMANRTALEFAGVEEQDVIGRPFAETPYWTHSPRAQQDIRDAIERALEGDFVRFETTHVSAKGETRDFDFCISPVTDDAGRVIYLVPEGHDITERNQTEAELREREEMIRALVETSKDWIWALNLQGIHTYSNPAVEDILGYRPDELVGRGALDLMHSEDRSRVEAILPDCIGGKHGWRNLLIRWRTRDDEWRYLESTAVPILDDGGELLGFRGVDRDVTERIAAEEALRESEERYRSFFENSCDSMAILRDGVFVDCNAAAVALLGFRDRNEVVGKTPGELSPETQPGGMLSSEKAGEVMEIARRQGTHRFEWVHAGRDGIARPVEVVLTLVPIGEDVQLHAVWRDLRQPI